MATAGFVFMALDAAPSRREVPTLAARLQNCPKAIVRLIDGYDRELSSDFRLTTMFAVVTGEGFAVE